MTISRAVRAVVVVAERRLGVIAGLVAGLVIGLGLWPGAPPAARAQPAGADFAPQVRVMFRVAACGGDDAIPPRFSVRTIAAHCRDMTALYASYRRSWLDRVRAFAASVRPRDVPATAIYPFGGGDLSAALAVFPDATELTTISLEAAGDIRVIDTIGAARLGGEVRRIAADIRRLYRSGHSTTQSLQDASHAELPGTILFALAGLAVHDMEPVALRYFDIARDGSLRYLGGAELDQRVAELARSAPAAPAAPAAPRKLRHHWSEQVSAFANVEIQFRPRGDPAAAVRTYRHVVANLDDSHLAADDSVLRYLRGMGKVAVITKAASFLLWYDDFSRIRDYLLRNTAWMISDASGLPPRHAGPAGFEQITYGAFTGPYFIKDKHNIRAEFVTLWKSQPHRELAFRFGYPDAKNHNHLMITRPATGAVAPAGR